MITNLNSLKTMEQLLNTSWLMINLGAFYVGLQAKLIVLQVNFLGLDIEVIKNVALIIGIISSIFYVIYLATKIYKNIIETNILKRDNGIKKLFK